MNNRGQTGIVGAVFALIMFVIIWALWLGSWINEWAERLVVDNSLTGIEAFLAANINLWVILGVMVSFMAYMYFGGRR